MGGLDGDFSYADCGIANVWVLTLCNFSCG